MSTAGGDPALPYVVPLIAEARAGQGSGHMHLGLWPSPPARITAEDWRAAQDRMTAMVLDLADLRDGQRIADIACGLGGTLRAIAARVRSRALFGVNIDPVQLQLCPSDLADCVQADATALPFSAQSLDRAICLEAAFHFSDRAAFLASVAGALAPGGLLVLADILLQPGPLTPGEGAALAGLLRRDFGPWPQPWLTPAELETMAARAGFERIAHHDITARTRPSHAFICGPRRPEPPRSGIEALRFLHESGLLHYGIFVLRRPGSQP
ncbi:SAM-dependent methyltransferase [Thetidibacter halocola]|uniref:Methyltransferase domain-containing protein n=1 Tax=Thetidibacter halocola TaxID=2827239 RepID=A0A8J8BAE1_9RHOB|nr:class I SAM-dependent methyltransferase [Thetidibacter halocola]MBS0126814.1 methyltransferase domain-containing protein [Thetidibacter halocola]